MRFLRKRRIETRQMVLPINFAKHVKIKKKFKIAEDISLSSLHLPSGFRLTNKQIKYIAFNIRLFFKKK
jgi:dTDP-4-amino-4,6-dideoxygalactose transaminase